MEATNRISRLFNDRRAQGNHVDAGGSMAPAISSGYPEPEPEKKSMYQWTGEEP